MDLLTLLFLPMIILGIYLTLKDEEFGNILLFFGVFGIIFFPTLLNLSLDQTDELNKSALLIVFEKMWGDGEPECIEWDTVDCEIYDIPLELCEKKVEITGPYWNEKETIRYEGEICVKNEND